MPVEFFKSSTIDPTILFFSLLGMVLFVSLLVYGNHRYQWFKKYKQFEEELEVFDLNVDEENILTDMVKRYKRDEPLDTIHSLQEFDEMVSEEMLRLLGSQASSATKEAFVALIYDIRQKTFFPDLIAYDIQKNLAT